MQISHTCNGMGPTYCPACYEEAQAEGLKREEEQMKKFRIVKPGTDEDVFGGPVGVSNAYIAAYPSIHKDSKRPRDLEVGEHSVATYSLGGCKGTYWIVRVE